MDKKIIYLSPDVADISPSEPDTPSVDAIDGGGKKKVHDDTVVIEDTPSIESTQVVKPAPLSVLVVDTKCEAKVEHDDGADDGDIDGDDKESVNTQELMSLHPHYMMLESFFKIDDQTCCQLLKRMILQMQDLTTHVKELKDVIRDMKKK